MSPGMTTDDFLYELGSGTVLPELDDNLQRRPGRATSWPSTPSSPDGPVDFKVLVKEVKEKVLPEVTDEWAGEASEFDTVDELRADIAKRIEPDQAGAGQHGAAQRRGRGPGRAGRRRPAGPAGGRRDRAPGARPRAPAGSPAAPPSPSTWRPPARPPEQVVGGLRAGGRARRSRPTWPCGPSPRPSSSSRPTPTSTREIERLAASYNVKPAELRRNLERADQMPAVRSDWKKSKALEWLVEHVEVVDSDGQPIDRALLEPAIRAEQLAR